MARTRVTKLSSASTRSAASRATSAPLRPIATPIAAASSAGASLTPSPLPAPHPPPPAARARLQRGSVVAAVARHGDDLARPGGCPHDAQLVLGPGARHDAALGS